MYLLSLSEISVPGQRHAEVAQCEAPLALVGLRSRGRSQRPSDIHCPPVLFEDLRVDPVAPLTHVLLRQR